MSKHVRHGPCQRVRSLASSLPRRVSDRLRVWMGEMAGRTFYIGETVLRASAEVLLATMPIALLAILLVYARPAASFALLAPFVLVATLNLLSAQLLRLMRAQYRVPPVMRGALTWFTTLALMTTGATFGLMMLPSALPSPTAAAQRLSLVKESILFLAVYIPVHIIIYTLLETRFSPGAETTAGAIEGGRIGHQARTRAGRRTGNSGESRAKVYLGACVWLSVPSSIAAAATAVSWALTRYTGGFPSHATVFATFLAIAVTVKTIATSSLSKRSRGRR